MEFLPLSVVSLLALYCRRVAHLPPLWFDSRAGGSRAAAKETRSFTPQPGKTTLDDDTSGDAGDHGSDSESDDDGGGKKLKIAPELEEITFLFGTKFKSFDVSLSEATDMMANEMHSIGETKGLKLMDKDEAPRWVRYNKRMLTRNYPAGTTLSSSPDTPDSP